MTAFDQIEHASRTDVGVRRSHNQDHHAMLLAGDVEHWQSRGHVFLVADGMGAHAVGELASELAAGIIPHTFEKYALEGARPALNKAFQEANASIHARGQQNREFLGMGTTATVLIVRPEGAWVGHVGDSRAYRIRGPVIEQLSYDHSLAWELARRRNVRPESIEGVPSNVIVRSLGPEPLVQVDIEGPHPLRKGDIFLLCSDGLSGVLSDHELGAVVAVLPPAEACHFLVDLANLRGGPDNITVVIVRLARTGEPFSRDPQGSVQPPVLKLPPFQLQHWPLYVLFLAVVIAFAAAFLTVFKLPGKWPALVLATGCLVAGLAGLALHHSREQRQPKEPTDSPPPKTYRKTLVQIDQAMVDKLTKAATDLAAQARDKQWELDWITFERHYRLAEDLIKKKDWPAAFAETCRALRPLTEALQRHRNKEEVFQPLWDRTQD